MNKLITPMPSGGVPISNEDLLMIQNEAHDALNALCKGVADAFIVNGCTATVSGANVTITSGLVFLNSQIMRFNGYTGPHPVYIVPDAPTTVKRIFKDGVNKDATVENKAVPTTATPSGDYITFSPQSDARFTKIINKPNDPIGTIKMWGGSVAKFDGTGLGLLELAGWALCNGSNGTIDLSERFPVGYKATNTDYDTIGETGGAKEVTLTAAQSGTAEHTHGVTDGGHSHTVGTFQSGASGDLTTNVSPVYAYNGTKATSTQTTGIAINNATAEDADQPHENRPPYAVVAFIQRIA